MMASVEHRKSFPLEGLVSKEQEKDLALLKLTKQCLVQLHKGTITSANVFTLQSPRDGFFSGCLRVITGKAISGRNQCTRKGPGLLLFPEK